MTEVFAYGNSRQMVVFKVFINEDLITGLIGLGYLEPGQFDYQDYLEVLDRYDSFEMALPIRDAVIDFYEDKRQELEDKIYEDADSEEIEYFESLTDLEKLMYANDVDRFLGCVEIVETDPENPYKNW